MTLLLFPFMMLNAQTTWQSAIHFGGVNADYAGPVCLDKTGNVFIAGRYFFPQAIFGSDTLPSRGTYELFITKLDPKGNYLWTKSAGGYNPQGGSEDLWDMYCDLGSNSLVLAGTMVGSDKNIGGCSFGGEDVVFLSKVDTEGFCIWAVKQADLGNPYMISICPDNTGHIYMTGNTMYESYFNGTEPVQPGGFLAKFNASSGSLMWAKKILDRNGYLSDVSFYNDGLVIGGGSAVDILNLDSSKVICRNRDTFISRFDTNGNLIWVKTMGGPNRDDGGDIQLDVFGNIYTCGIFQGMANFGDIILDNSGKEDVYLAKYSNSGLVQWAIQLQLTGNIYTVYISTNKQGETFLNGTFSGTAKFGEQTITAYSANDLFVARYNSKGECVNVIHSGNSFNNGCTTNNRGEIFITGNFSGTTNFGSVKLVSYGSDDAFFAKHDALTSTSQPLESPQPQLLIYANPTTGKCTVTIPEEFLHEKQLTLQVFDFQGKLIEKTVLTLADGKIRLNLEAQAKGMYQVVLDNGRKSYTGKVVFE